MSEELALVPRPDLKARAHALKPVVWIGSAGLSENVMHELDQGLRSHELIKVKFMGFRDQKRELTEELAAGSGSALVGMIGNIAILYRQQPNGFFERNLRTPRCEAGTAHWKDTGDLPAST